MGLEVPKSEETAAEYESEAEIPEIEEAASTKDRKPENSFEEIVKGYMLLALQAHGIETEDISIAQIDFTFDKYSKNEAV